MRIDFPPNGNTQRPRLDGNRPNPPPTPSTPSLPTPFFCPLSSIPGRALFYTKKRSQAIRWPGLPASKDAVRESVCVSLCVGRGEAVGTIELRREEKEREKERKRRKEKEG